MSDALRIVIGLALMVVIGLACQHVDDWFARRATRREAIRCRLARVRVRRGR